MKYVFVIALFFITSSLFAQQELDEKLAVKYSQQEILNMKKTDKYRVLKIVFEDSYVFKLEEKKEEEFENLVIDNYELGQTINFLQYDIVLKPRDQYFRINNSNQIYHLRGTAYASYKLKH